MADKKGQKCYICLEAVYPRTGEGLVRGCACGDRDGVSSPELGVVHVSCLAEQAKILFAEAEEHNLGVKARYEGFQRWDSCSLCEQKYHGVVYHALGWACWKTYVGRPEGDQIRRMPMGQIGRGLSAASHHTDASTVQEAQLSMLRRIGGSEEILAVQANLAITYQSLGRLEQTLSLLRDVYLGYVKLYGEEHKNALISANNYAASIFALQRFQEAKSLLGKIIPVARRVLGGSDPTTLRMRLNCGWALYIDVGATLSNLREAVTTLEDTERTARHVLGNSHPTVEAVGMHLQNERASLCTRM